MDALVMAGASRPRPLAATVALVAFAVVLAVGLTYLLGLALGGLRPMRGRASFGRPSEDDSDDTAASSDQVVEVRPQAPSDEAVVAETAIAVAQEAATGPSPRTRKGWLRGALAGAICLAAVAAAVLFAPVIIGWHDTIFVAWIAAGVVLFLPVGAVLRLPTRVLHRFRTTRPHDSRLELAIAPAGPGAQSVAPPPARRLLPPWTVRLSRGALGIALYAGFVIGAIYYTPTLMSQALGTDQPMAAVTSSSMWPALKDGDFVILKGVDSAEDLTEGDIIAFRHEEGFAIHRIVSIEGEQITTKGDANRKADPPIMFDDVIGRVPKIAGRLAKIPYLGNVASIFGTNTDAPVSEAPTTFEGTAGAGP